MRQSFDQSVPLWEQMKRARIHAHTGRKHQHRKGPGKPRKKVDPRIEARRRKHSAMISAYFRGDLDECP